MLAVGICALYGEGADGRGLYALNTIEFRYTRNSILTSSTSIQMIGPLYPVSRGIRSCHIAVAQHDRARGRGARRLHARGTRRTAVHHIGRRDATWLTREPRTLPKERSGGRDPGAATRHLENALQLAISALLWRAQAHERGHRRPVRFAPEMRDTVSAPHHRYFYPSDAARAVRLLKRGRVGPAPSNSF